MKIIVFTGPTISIQEAECILNAIYLPPAKQSDIVRVVHDDKPDVIAIIDSVIFSEMPIWHKEILYAIDKGVTLYGSSAIGALRAVEFWPFGMRGVGQVYEKFKNLELEDDDEVLARFVKRVDQYIRISESMVNLRATFDEALAQGIINDEAYATLIAVAKGIYYPDRTFANIFEQAKKEGVPEDFIIQVKEFVSDTYVDVQKNDAIKLLHELATLTPVDLAQKPGGSVGKYGTLFYTLYNRDRGVRLKDIEIPQYYISNYVGLNHPGVEDLNFHALNRKLAFLLAEVFGIQASQKEIERESERFKKKHQLTDSEIFEAWLKKNDLNHSDFLELMEELTRIRKTQQWYIMMQGYLENTKDLLEELKLNNEYLEWKEKTINREYLLQDQEDTLKEIYNRENLVDLFKDSRQYREFPWNVSVLDSLLETGMDPTTLTLEFAKEKVAREKTASLVDNIFVE